MHIEETDRARVKLMKYRTLICTLGLSAENLAISSLFAIRAVGLDSCWDIAKRISFVVSKGSWDKVLEDSTMNAVTTAENRPVYTNHEPLERKGF